MNKYLSFICLLFIISCSDNNHNQQPQQQAQYQQQPIYYPQQDPQYAQQQQPIVVQQPMYSQPQYQNHESGTGEMIQNMAIGAMAGHALSNIGSNSAGYNSRQYQPPVQHVTKNVTINRTYNRPRSNFSSRYRK